MKSWWEVVRNLYRFQWPSLTLTTSNQPSSCKHPEKTARRKSARKRGCRGGRSHQSRLMSARERPYRQLSGANLRSVRRHGVWRGKSSAAVLTASRTSVKRRTLISRFTSVPPGALPTPSRRRAVRPPARRPSDSSARPSVVVDNADVAARRAVIADLCEERRAEYRVHLASDCSGCWRPPSPVQVCNYQRVPSTRRGGCWCCCWNADVLRISSADVAVLNDVVRRFSTSRS